MGFGVTTRRSSFRLATIVFLLTVGVFFWGLKYKLSLYDSPGSTSSMSVPQAKLLSQKERPPAIQADSLALQSQPQMRLIVISAFLIATICLNISTVWSVPMWLAANEDVRHRAHFRSSFFSFRPPPTPLQHN
jgi:hypothetical protein